MTKEEFIRNGIENRKEDKTLCCNVNCTNCPYEGATCGANVIYDLLDYIIGLETKTETNLEHYWKGLSIGFLSHNDDAYQSYREQSMALFDWLFAPYEEQKTKYKLSRFECDLLDSCYDYTCCIKDSWMLNSMHDKGYFKDIYKETKIKDVLDNAEVIDSE